MNKILCSMVAVFLLAGCVPQKDANQFTLTGTINETDSKEIYLRYSQNDSLQIIDTLAIVNGKFQCKGIVEKPAQTAVLYMGNRRERGSQRILRFYLEPAEIHIAIDTCSFNRPTVTGSLTQAQEDSLQTALASIEAEMVPLRAAMRKEKDPEKHAELREQMAPYNERIEKVVKTFIQTHPDSYAAPFHMRGMLGKMTYDEIKALYDNFSDSVKKYGDVEAIEKELTLLERIRPGASAPDFVTTNLQGDSIRFSEVTKGKYVLLDFWASWCVPCRKSFPHVKALYNKYKDKGLEVFCVADNDDSPDQWREAIRKDGIEHFHHVLRGMKVISLRPLKLDRSNDVSEKYAIHFLPTKYLIDREGKIIGKMNDEELDVKLKEIFGF